MNNDLEEEILSRINKKHRVNTKSIITGQPDASSSSNCSPLPLIPKVQAAESQNPNEHGPSEEELAQIFEAQVLASFDLMLMSKVRSIEGVLTSIESKVEGIEPKIQIVVNGAEVFSKIEHSVDAALNKCMAGVKSSLSMSINYYNSELCEREKKFNSEHEETARVAIEGNMNLLEMKGKRSEVDFKRLEERIKMLMRSESKCEELLSKIDSGLTKMADSIRDFNEGFVVDARYRSALGEEYELVEMTEEELLEKILQNYEVEFNTPEMKDYIYSEIGVKRTNQ